jgi:hypothetical protein
MPGHADNQGQATSIGTVEQAMTDVSGDVATALLDVPVLAAGLYAVVAGFRAGIGAGAGGVTVRSGLGRRQRVPWSDTGQFTAVRRGYDVYMVAVVCRSRKPLTTTGCCFMRWRRT